MAVCRRWDVLATTVGVVTETGRLVVEWHGEVVVDVPPRTVAHEGPVYERPYARPDWLDARQADSPTPQRLSRPTTRRGAAASPCSSWSASPNLSSRAWVTDQYDRYVMGNTALATPDDAGVVRIDEETGLGVALSLDAQGRYGALDPYAGAQLALVEAYRNVATTGRDPAGRDRLPQLRLARGPGRDVAVRRGRARPDRRLPRAGLPVTGGNVSFYNQTARRRHPPDPGRRCARRARRRGSRRTPSGWPATGLELLLLGDDARRAGRLGVGARRARSPRRPAARGRPGRRAGAGRAARRRRPATGWSLPPTTCPRAASPRRWSRAACGTASAPRSSIGHVAERDGAGRLRRCCSASRPPACCSPYRPRTWPRCGSAPTGPAYRSPGSAEPAATHSSWKASSPSRCSSCVPLTTARCRRSSAVEGLAVAPPVDTPGRREQE